MKTMKYWPSKDSAVELSSEPELLSESDQLDADKKKEDEDKIKETFVPVGIQKMWQLKLFVWNWQMQEKCHTEKKKNYPKCVLGHLEWI